jgi:hypothetical protein
MGAWGHKSFQNDSALDWLSDLIHGGAPVLGAALDAAGASDLEVDEASAALAAAEIVAAALGHGDDRLDEDAAVWLSENREAARKVGALRARQAVEQVLAKSELRELGDENGADTEWHADVRELLRRLT